LPQPSLCLPGVKAETLTDIWCTWDNAGD
jgi:hypothetical protein